MDYTHPLDRLVYRLRKPIIAAIYLAGPITLFSYGWGIKQIFDVAPGWVTALVVVANIIVWAGIGCLFDQQQERRQSSRPEQS